MPTIHTPCTSAPQPFLLIITGETPVVGADEVVAFRRWHLGRIRLKRLWEQVRRTVLCTKPIRGTRCAQEDDDEGKHTKSSW